MSYKVAIATSDGKNLDWHFGEAPYFQIYEVVEESYSFVEKRAGYAAGKRGHNPSHFPQGEQPCCGQKKGCANGNAVDYKVQMISDCRAVICKKIGLPITKQFEKKAILSFSLDGEVEKAIGQLAKYYYRMDQHRSLKDLVKE